MVVGHRGARAALICATLVNRGEAPELTVRPADLEAPHLSALSSNGSTALYI